MQILVAMPGDYRKGKVVHVFATIAVFRNVHLFAALLEIAGVGGLVEQFHLRSGVVHVVLALHVESSCLEGVGERASEHRAPCVSDVDRPCGIDADEFDLDAPAASEVGVAEFFALFDHLIHLGLEPFIIEGEIDEAGTRYPYVADDIRVGKGVHYRLAYCPGIHLHGTGELHGQAAREIAIFGFLRPFYREVAYFDCRELSGRLSGSKRRAYTIGYLSSD